MCDQCHKIVLNTKGENDDEADRTLVDFLHYVEQSSDERIPRDGDERLLKEEAKEEGRAEGREVKCTEIIANMLRRNMPEEDICAITECSPEFVAGVREKLQEQGKQ